MQLSATDQDWESVARNADRMLAVNPLVAAPHRYRSEAAEKLHDAQAASESYRRCWKWTPPTRPKFISDWPRTCMLRRKTMKLSAKS